MDQVARNKWNLRYQSAQDSSPGAAEVLSRYHYFLPETGLALDLACGLGANAILLGQSGLHTEAWDISEVATARLASNASAQGVGIRTRCRDVIAEPPEPKSFDVIVVSRFLHRPLAPHLISALRPSGWLFYQTFVHGSEKGPGNPQYRLGDNELLSLFGDLTIRAYHDHGATAGNRPALRFEAMLVAQKGDGG